MVDPSDHYRVSHSLGELNEFSYNAEYARASRTNCRACGTKIKKGQIKIGTVFREGPTDQPETRWYKFECLKNPTDLHGNRLSVAEVNTDSTFTPEALAMVLKDVYSTGGGRGRWLSVGCPDLGRSVLGCIEGDFAIRGSSCSILCFKICQLDTLLHYSKLNIFAFLRHFAKFLQSIRIL